jgi:hypothetical protein
MRVDPERYLEAASTSLNDQPTLLCIRCQMDGDGSDAGGRRADRGMSTER